MKPYLKPTDEGAFYGYHKQGLPSCGTKDYECPKCRGYGGWNLRLDSYGPGRHFRTCCNQCDGYGYVQLEESGCAHEFEEISRKGCMILNQCTKCGRQKMVDSSD